VSAREVCGSCGSTSLDDVLSLPATPLADVFPAEPGGVGLTRWPLGLLRCARCTLVQLSEIVPDNLLYGPDYGFYTGASPAAVAYWTEYARKWIDHFRAPGSDDPADTFVVEVACNDGVLLGQFADAGFRTLGVEPAAGPAAVAGERELEVLVEPFTHQVGLDIAREHGKADLVIANNVLAHVEHPYDFVRGLRALVADDGVVSIEVQYLADLVLGHQFDHVYHEHRSFFSMISLRRLLEDAGLFVHDVQRVSGQGGSLRVLAGPAAIPPQPGMLRLTRTEHSVLSAAALHEFQYRVDLVRHRAVELIDAERRAGRRIVGYGASAKSCTMLNALNVGPDVVDAVVDLTPGKIGRYTPGTSIPIVARVDLDPADTTYLLLVGNYLGPVLARSRGFFADGGRMIVPLPVPVVI
jgi:2-polyprenyl-3-methyl-5-hydroxy-6-metoxy-1,4-benzoquinol methylase